MRLLSVDPGCPECGWVVWASNTTYIHGHGVIRAPRTLPWKVQSKHVSENILAIISDHHVNYVAIEYPGFFASLGGQVTAKSGALVKLCVMVGRLLEACERQGCAVRLVPVADWKAQLSKPEVIRRIKEHIHPHHARQLKSHSWDAAGIGLYMKGIRII